MKRNFTFPESVTVLYYLSGKRPEAYHVIVHCLDFDLAGTGSTMDEATEVIKGCIAAYIEYGLEEGLESYISRPAPKQYWDTAKKATEVDCQDTILVEDNRVPGDSTVVSIKIKMVVQS